MICRIVYRMENVKVVENLETEEDFKMAFFVIFMSEFDGLAKIL